MEVRHQWSKSVVLNGGSQRNAGVHGDVPHWTPETKAVDELDGHCHVHRVDGYYFVVYLAVIHVTVWEVDLAGVHTERHDGCVVNDVCGIHDAQIRAIVGITNSTRLG